MGQQTGIEWCHHTMNPWRGCQRVSEGCRNCYAETLSGRNPGTLGVWGPKGTRVVAAESYWKQPLMWDREAKKVGERRRVFCASLADVFEDWQGPMIHPETAVAMDHQLCVCHGCGKWQSFIEACECGAERLPRPLKMSDVRARLFNLIDQTPNLDWLVLTKRPENIRRMLPMGLYDGVAHAMKPNVWLGTSVENQATKCRIDLLRQIPAVVRFLSLEPLLEDLGDLDLTGIHWVICGGESGPGARPMQLEWARKIGDQCEAAGVPWFFKQAGSKPMDWNSGDRPNHEPPQLAELRLKDRKGGDLSELRHDLRVREFPEVR